MIAIGGRKSILCKTNFYKQVPYIDSMGNIDIIWQNLNNIGIAITIIILFYILWVTSSSFTEFGTGQQINMGFIYFFYSLDLSKK